MSKVNENRPGYKETKVGWIPEEWSITSLGEVSDYINGRGFKPYEWGEEGLPIIRIQNLNGSNEFNYYSGEYNPKLLVLDNELLFAWSGSRGSSFGPHIWKGGKGLLNYHTWKVQVFHSVVKNYLFYSLSLLTSIIEDDAHGQAALVHIQKQFIKKYRIPLPPLPEQKKIAQILSSWDQAIEKLERLIELKELRKKGLMQLLLTGKKRLPEHSPFIQPQKAIPSSWKKTRLKDATIDIIRRNTTGSRHVLTASGTSGLVDQKEYFNRSIAASDLGNYLLLKKGEFAYNRSSMKGYPFGAIKRLEKYDEGVLSTLYMCFSCVSEKLDPAYANEYFESGLCNGQLNGRVQVGARAHGLLNISKKDFYGIELSIPGLDEQKAIVRVANNLTNELKAHRRVLDAVKTQKKGLMQKLLTGEIRVKVTEEDYAE